jgi:hypothetical protein
MLIIFYYCSEIILFVENNIKRRVFINPYLCLKLSSLREVTGHRPRTQKDSWRHSGPLCLDYSPGYSSRNSLRDQIICTVH